MLGVLAIVAVLSVGGIAGYSKAMEDYKIQKLISEYNYLILGLSEYKQNFQDTIKTKAYHVVTDVAQNLNLVPRTWKNKTPILLQDSQGNVCDIRYKNHSNSLWDGIVITVSLTGNDKYKQQFCTEIFKNTIKPLHKLLNVVRIIGSEDISYLGDTYCSKKCIRDMTLNQIYDICNLCKSQSCGIIFIF